ncbi:hypothetical protein DFH06DRAFT_1179739, partial [Mycena polygramma]
RLFLESRVVRRETRRRANAEKQVRNTARATQRSAGATPRDTIGEDEAMEDDSDDEHEVPDPSIDVSGQTQPPGPAGSSTDAHTILEIMKTLNPQSQALFLSLLTSQTSTPSGPSSTPAPPPALIAPPPTLIPSIFDATRVRPAAATGSRIPFSARIRELAVAGVYLELTMFTNEMIHDMFVNQNSPKYQPKKRTIIDADGKPVLIYTMDPSIFEDQNTLSPTRFNEAHHNYHRWYVDNAPADAMAQLDAYDNHRRICTSTILPDEEDFMMIKIWCKDWMQRATWNPTSWDGERYQDEFNISRARYFENKVARRMERLREAEAYEDANESDDDRERTPPGHGGAERGSDPGVRYSPYARER